MQNTLFIIPARGGSKGIPNKNIKLLGGKPLINYSLEIARSITSELNICVSTDSDLIIQVLQQAGYNVPFIRPSDISTDSASTNSVLIHALEYYKNTGRIFDNLILLQPTSPFRNINDVLGAYKLYDENDDIDMVVSVVNSNKNPYFSLFEENEYGYLKKVKDGVFHSRQVCPNVYAYNGSIYIINVKSLLQKNLHEFTKIKKFEMPKIRSIDIDDNIDWMWAEFLLEKNLI